MPEGALKLERRLQTAEARAEHDDAFHGAINVARWLSAVSSTEKRRSTENRESKDGEFSWF